MTPPGALIIGSGGHAKVVIETARAAGFAVHGLLDDAVERQGSSVLGVRVVGYVEPASLTDEQQQLIVGVGDNDGRASLVARFSRLTQWTTAIHPCAVVSETASLGAGSVVFAGTVVQAESHIGAHTILNTACSVDHDCRVGAFVHVAPGARLAGGVTVGEGALIGLGACVIPGVRVGVGATVGAGAVVIEDVPDHTVVTGVPARARPRPKA